MYYDMVISLNCVVLSDNELDFRAWNRDLTHVRRVKRAEKETVLSRDG